MNRLQWTSALLALSMSCKAGAGAIGLPETTARIGYGVGVYRLAVDDPDGPTQAAVSAQPLTLIYTDWLPGGLRYWAEGYFARTRLDAANGKLGEDVSRYGIQFAVQHNVRWGSWSPWLGVGMDLSRNQYSKRYTVDSDGFLLNTYADRTATAVGINIHAVSEWALERNWDLSAKLEQVIPVSGGVNETSLTVGILYLY